METEQREHATSRSRSIRIQPALHHLALNVRGHRVNYVGLGPVTPPRPSQAAAYENSQRRLLPGRVALTGTEQAPPAKCLRCGALLQLGSVLFFVEKTVVKFEHVDGFAC